MKNKQNNQDLKLAKAIITMFTNEKGRLPKSKEEITNYILEKGGEKFIAKLQLKLVLSAAHGAKLQYLKSLKNKCADDEELYYYKRGGSVGCGCKKKEDGGEVTKAEPGMKMLLFIEANKKRRAIEEKKKKQKGTWAETTEFVPGKTIERGNGGPDAKQLDSAVRDRKDNPENKVKVKEKFKENPKYALSSVMKCGSKMKEKCGGVVEKFKAAKCGSKLKKHLLGGSLNGIPFMLEGTPEGGIKRGINGEYYSNPIPWDAGRSGAADGPMRLFNDPYIGAIMMAMGPMAGRSLKSLGTPTKTINGVNYYRTADGKLVTALELARSMVNIGPKLAKKVDYKPMKNSRKGNVGIYDKVKRLSYETLRNDGYFDAEGNWINNNGINWDYTKPIFKPKYAEDIDNAFLMEGLKKGGKLN